MTMKKKTKPYILVKLEDSFPLICSKNLIIYKTAKQTGFSLFLKLVLEETFLELVF